MNRFPEYEVEKLYDDLKNILPQKYITTSLFERLNNALDPYPNELDREELPYVVVRPGSAEEVSELMKYANSVKVPIFIRGSGTSFSGASSYHYKGIVLNTNKLNHLEIIKENGFFECGPGIRALAVSEELDKQGYFLPMVPGSIRVASMGGIISNNTSGHVVDSCLGKPADYVLGLQVVLPTGEILETGTKSLRKPAGTDLTKFFVGGDGLLGIITNIRLRLVPTMKKAFGMAFFDDVIPLLRGVQRMYWEKVPVPLFMEFMDKRSAQIGFGLQGLEAPEGPIVIFLSNGQTEEEASAKIDRLVEVFQKESPLRAEKIEDLNDWQKIWTAREVIGPYLMQSAKGSFATGEIVSTLENLLDCFRETLNMAEGMPTLKGMDLYLFGHIGALTIHPVFIIPADWPIEKKVKAVDEMFLKEAELNFKYGTCGGEWGQFARRGPFYLKRYGEKNYQLVKGLKKLFDPNNILNPGVLDED